MYKQQLRKLETEYWCSQNQKNINISDESGEFMLQENEENVRKNIGSEKKQKLKAYSPQVIKTHQSRNTGNTSTLLKDNNNADKSWNNGKIINRSSGKSSSLFPQNEGFSNTKDDCYKQISTNLLNSDKKNINKSLFERFCEKKHSEKPLENLENDQKNMKIRYLFCRETGHEMNQLNMVCLDANCASRGLICCMCLERHQSHLARCVPFQKLVNHLKNTDQKYRREFSLQCLSSEHATIQTALSRFREGLDSLIDTLKINFLRQEQTEIQHLQDAYISEDSRVEQFLQRMQSDSANKCSLNSSSSEIFKKEMEEFLNSLDYSFTDDINDAQTKRARWESKGELISTEILKNLSSKRFSIHQLLEGCLNMLSHTLTQSSSININTNDQIHNFSSHSSSDNQEEHEICVEEEDAEIHNNEISNQNILPSIDEKSFNTYEDCTAHIEMDIGEYESCDERQQQQQQQRQQQREFIRIDSLEEIAEPETTKRRKISHNSSTKKIDNQRRASIMIIDSVTKQDIDQEEIELDSEEQQFVGFDQEENNLQISRITPSIGQTETEEKLSFIIPTDPSSSSSSQCSQQRLNEGIRQDTDCQFISSESLLHKTKLKKLEEEEQKPRNSIKTEAITPKDFRLIDYLVSSPETSSPEENNNVRSNCSSLESKNMLNMDLLDNSDKKSVIFSDKIGRSTSGNNLFNQCNYQSNNNSNGNHAGDNEVKHNNDAAPFVQDTLILHKKQIELNSDTSQSEQQVQQQQQLAAENSSNEVHDIPSNSEGLQQQSQLFQMSQQLYQESQQPCEIMTFQEQFKSPANFSQLIPANNVNNSNTKSSALAAEQVFFSQLSVPGDQFKYSQQTAHFGLEYSPTFSPRKFSRLTSSVKSKEQSATVSPKKYQQNNSESPSKNINQSPTTRDLLSVRKEEKTGKESLEKNVIPQESPITQKSNGSSPGIPGIPRSPSTLNRKMKRTKQQICIPKENQQQQR